MTRLYQLSLCLGSTYVNVVGWGLLLVGIRRTLKCQCRNGAARLGRLQALGLWDFDASDVLHFTGAGEHVRQFQPTPANVTLTQPATTPHTHIKPGAGESLRVPESKRASGGLRRRKVTESFEMSGRDGERGGKESEAVDIRPKLQRRKSMCSDDVYKAIYSTSPLERRASLEKSMDHFLRCDSRKGDPVARSPPSGNKGCD